MRFFILLLFCFPFCLSAQQKEVVVKLDKSIRGDEVNVIFNAHSTAYGRQVLILELTGGVYDRASSGRTIVKELQYGTNRLLSLSNVKGTPGYGYTWVSGCLNIKPAEVTYLFPFAPGKTSRIQALYNIDEEHLGKDAPRNWASYSMTAVTGDTVFAARRGTVIEVVEHKEVPQGEHLSYARDVNYVIIEHEDCTRGKYELFARNGVFPAKGAKVEAGEALGTIMEGQAYLTGTHLRFSVYYPELDRQQMIDLRKKRGKTTLAYVKPNFVGAGVLEKGGNYTAEFQQDLIFQEMSKREIKRWRKRNGG